MSNINEFVIEKERGNFGELCLVGYTGSDAEVTIPNEVKYITKDAFKDCQTLVKVVIPEGVRGIAGNAFSGCTALETVVFPEKMWFIRGDSFSNCTALKEIVLPKLEMDIGSCFKGCTGLTKITISDCLEVRENAFRDSESAEFVFDGDFKVHYAACDVLKKVLYPKHFAKPELKREEALFAAKYILDGNGTKEYRAEWLKYIKGQKKHFIEKKKAFKEIQQLMLQEKIITPEDIGYIEEDTRPKRSISIEEAKSKFTIKRRSNRYAIERFDNRIVTSLIREPRIREVGKFASGVTDRVIDIPDMIGKTPVDYVAVGLIPPDAIVIASAEVFNKLSRSARAETSVAYLSDLSRFPEDEASAIHAFVKKYSADVAEKLMRYSRLEMFVQFVDIAAPKAALLDKLIEGVQHAEIRGFLMEQKSKGKKSAKSDPISDFQLDAPKKMTVAEIKKNWTYRKWVDAKTNEEYITLGNYKGSEKHVAVPSFVGKVPVKYLEGEFPSFVESVEITSTQIEVACSFRNCAKMADENGFIVVYEGGIPVLTDYVGPKNVKTLHIPQGVKKTRKGALRDQSFAEVVFPDGFEVLAQNTFWNCSNLCNVILPESLKRIEQGVFGGCQKLMNIYIPAGVEKIGPAFYDREVVLCGERGSVAEQFAKDHGFKFNEGKTITETD